MLFNSVHFLLFFPIVVALYYLLPTKIRWMWLLISSYYFYMSWNVVFAFLIITSTVISYFSAIGIQILREKISLSEKNQKIGEKTCLLFSILTNALILFFFKYFNFFNDSFQNVFQKFGLEWKLDTFDILLPVGISFYTFEVISYTVDVYRGTIKAEKNLAKYALFLSFFPKLVAGPIERPQNLIPQIHKLHKFNYSEFRSGMMLILWGLFQKVMIADRLAILVNTVYNNVDKHTGADFFVATFFFSFQILCDFSAYSDIAIGASKVLGFNLMNNFRRPYFAKSIREFWQRWHISLSTWFKDYLYIPLGGSKNGKLITYRNIIIVFLVSGLWHGANWTFIVWGGLHGIYQVFSLIFEPYRNYLNKFFRVNENSFSMNLFRLSTTFFLVSITWIFFRANTISDALFIIKSMLYSNYYMLFTDHIYNLGLNSDEFKIGIIMICILLLVSVLQRKIKIREFISSLWLPYRWFIYISVVISILIYGIYGNQYDPSQFIYFQF